VQGIGKDGVRKNDDWNIPPLENRGYLARGQWKYDVVLHFHNESLARVGCVFDNGFAMIVCAVSNIFDIGPDTQGSKECIARVLIKIRLHIIVNGLGTSTELSWRDSLEISLMTEREVVAMKDSHHLKSCQIFRDNQKTY